MYNIENNATTCCGFKGHRYSVAQMRDWCCRRTSL